MELEPGERPPPPVVCMVRLWLPDRPGTLGQLATRIGSVGGDVVGIDILERGGGRAVDELTVVLPGAQLLDLLLAEVGQVPGVAVEAVRVVPGELPDAGTVALGIAARLAEAAPAERTVQLCADLAEALEADWIMVLDLARAGTVHSSGPCPDPTWLAAFLAGSRHLDAESQVVGAPGDLAWTSVGGQLTAVVGRRSRPFHARERTQLGLLGRITAALDLPSPVA